VRVFALVTAGGRLLTNKRIHTNLLDLIGVVDKQQVRSTDQSADFDALAPYLIEQKTHRGDVTDLKLTDDRSESANI